jgi:hypothetical protein
MILARVNAVVERQPAFIRAQQSTPCDTPASIIQERFSLSTHNVEAFNFSGVTVGPVVGFACLDNQHFVQDIGFISVAANAGANYSAQGTIDKGANVCAGYTDGGFMGEKYAYTVGVLDEFHR